MPHNTRFKTLVRLFLLAGLWTALFLPEAAAASGPLSLNDAIREALEANLGIKSAGEEEASAQAVRDAQKTQFYPSFSTSYQYTRFYEKKALSMFGVTIPTKAKNEYAWSASFTQPLFTGFALLNRYRLSQLGLGLTGIQKRLARQDVVLAAKEAYFSLLKAEKIVSVAREAVALLEAFGKVAKDFYDVGMTPRNELLKADVELANSRQELTVAQNSLDMARASFNTLLRRPVHQPVQVQDVTDYAPLEMTADQCLAQALEHRLELVAADLQVDMKKKELELARKDYFPRVNLRGNYYQLGMDPDVRGGDDISDPSSWEIVASATWDFWQWGRTGHGVREKAGRLNQAQYSRQEVEDQIRLAVEQAFLKTREAEKNIGTVRTAIHQARENYRISEDRYKQQVATSTEVLDARTLLSRTMTNYYNALYDFKIAEANLYRAMGREVGQ